jgi:nucleotide sugar dehydrogenase
MKAGIIGLGYVGLPLATSLSRAGHQIVGFDTNAKVVGKLSSGQSHIQDVHSREVQDLLAAGGMFSAAEGDLKKLDAYVICVPTPLGRDGHPDLAYVESAARSVSSVLSTGALVVLESTTYPGTTEEVIRPLLEQGSGLIAGVDFHLAYSPERIDPGNPLFGVENTPKIVGGLTDRCADRATELYGSLGIQVVRAKGVREAELAKLLENTYRHVNIALVNEMVKFCGPLGIDLQDAIRCAATKPFGFEAFYPGPGVGGHCIPIDPNYLSYRVRSELGYPFRFVELAQEINASMPLHVVNRLQAELNDLGKPLKGARVLLMGITYKPNVADMRESPAEPIARLLRDRGAVIAYSDPFIPTWAVAGQELISQQAAECQDCDAVVLLQNHSNFSEPEILRGGRLVLDTRGVLQGETVRYL